MVCLVYSTQIGVLPEENSLCGNTSHWKYRRKKASSVRTNATSINIKSIFTEKQRKIFHFLKFPESDPMNLWEGLRFRALWHNCYVCLSLLSFWGQVLRGFSEHVLALSGLHEYGNMVVPSSLPCPYPLVQKRCRWMTWRQRPQLLTSSALDSPRALPRKPARWCQRPVLISRSPGRLCRCSSERGGFLHTIEIQPCSASVFCCLPSLSWIVPDFPGQSSLQWQSYDSPGSFWDSQAFPSKSLHPLQPIFKCLASVLKCWYWTKCKYSATSDFNLGLDPPFILVKCNKKER